MNWKTFDPRKDELEGGDRIRLANRTGRIYGLDGVWDGGFGEVIWEDDQQQSNTFDLSKFTFEIEDKPLNVRVNRETGRFLLALIEETELSAADYFNIKDIINSITTDET